MDDADLVLASVCWMALSDIALPVEKGLGISQMDHVS